MTIRRKYDDPQIFFSPEGDRIVPEYGLSEDLETVQVVGHTDLDKFIQSSKDSCSIDSLMEKYRITQDPGVFQVKRGFSGDVAGGVLSPADLIERLQTIYDQQSEDFQKKVDFSTFISTLSSITTKKNQKPDVKEEKENAERSQNAEA